MDHWEYYLNKALENMCLSKSLYNDQKYGLSAFHAQQGLELAIKSYCFKHKIDKSFTKKDALKTHLPSAVLLDKYFKHIIDLDNKDPRRHRYEAVEYGFNETTSLLERLQKILKQIQSHEIGPLKQVWKYSLEIPTDSKLTDELKEISKFQTNISANFSEEILNILRPNIIKKIRKKTKHIKSDQQLQRAMDALNQKFVELGFSHKFLDNFLTDPDLWKQEIEDYVNKTSPIKAFDTFVGDESIFSNALPGPQNKQNQNFVCTLKRLVWLALISPSILLSFPHEQIGRYPIMINDKMSEDWYYAKHDKLLQIIDGCDFGVKRIQAMTRLN